MDLTVKAKAVFPFVKPFPGVLSSNFGTFINGLLQDLGVNYQVHEFHNVSPPSHSSRSRKTRKKRRGENSKASVPKSFLKEARSL